MCEGGESFSGGRYTLLSPGASPEKVRPGDLLVARYGVLCSGTTWTATYAALAFARGVVHGACYALQRVRNLPSTLHRLLHDVAVANNCRNVIKDESIQGHCECGAVSGVVGVGCPYGCVRDPSRCPKCATVVDCVMRSTEFMNLADGANYHAQGPGKMRHGASDSVKVWPLCILPDGSDSVKLIS